MGDALPWLVNAASPPYADLIYQQKWQMARDTAERLVDEAQERLAARAADGCSADAAMRLVVFNGLSWMRTDPVEVTLPSAAAGTTWTLLDTENNSVPLQRTANGTHVFVASDIPPLGYSSFCLVSTSSDRDSTSAAGVSADAPGPEWTQPFANAYFRITPGRGGLQSVVDLASGTERETGPGTWVVWVMKQGVREI